MAVVDYDSHQGDTSYWTSSRLAAAIGRRNLYPPFRWRHAATAQLAELHSFFKNSTITPELVSDTSISPYCCVGALFFSVQDTYGDSSTNYSGSAVVIGEDLILTAAHNLQYEGRDSQRVIFIPQYDPDVDDAKNTKMKILSFEVSPKWALPHTPNRPKISPNHPLLLANFDVSTPYNFAHDLAVARVERVNNKSVASYSSGKLACLMDRTWAKPKVIGYPVSMYSASHKKSEITFLKRAMRESGTNSIRAPRNNNGSMEMESLMGKGASGGPWVGKKNNLWCVVGVQSSAYVGLGLISSPCFDGDNAEFINKYANKWGEGVTPAPTPPIVATWIDNELR